MIFVVPELHEKINKLLKRAKAEFFPIGNCLRHAICPIYFEACYLPYSEVIYLLNELLFTLYSVTEFLCSGWFFFLQTNFEFLTSHF